MGSPRPRPRTDFSSPTPPADTSPSLRDIFASRIHDLLERPLQSSFASLARPQPFPKDCWSRNLPGFLALVATSRVRVHLFVRLPKPHIRCALRFSRPLDAFLRTHAWRACSIPPPRPGLSRSGCSPLTQPSFLLGRRVPPCRCAHHAHHRSSVRAPGPRLRGLVPRERALPRARLFIEPALATLLEFSSSRILHPRRTSVLLGCPAHDLAADRLRSRARVPSRSSASLPARTSADPSLSRPTLLEFSSLPIKNQ